MGTKGEAMNIAIFVESYFHDAQMNGICVEKVANKLTEQGHNVVVFTSSKHVYDIPKYEEINGVKVYAIKRDLDTFMRLYIKHDKKNHRILSFIHKYYAMLVHLTMARFWPLRSVFMPFRYVRLAKKVFKNERIDAIVGTYFHIEEVLAALLLKKHNPQARMITYTLDAMTGRISPVFLKRPSLTRKSIERWEKLVYAKSDKICVMESHRAHYESGNYSQEILDKIRYVDVPLLTLNNSNNISEDMFSKEHGEGQKIIVYTGCSSQKNGSASYLIHLLKGIENTQLHLYGSVDEEIMSAIHESGLENKRVFFHGRVTHEDVEKLQQSADYLATFGSLNPCMVSGKIFEYFSKKKPIICTYKIEEDSNVPYIKKYPNAIIIKEDNARLFEETVRLNEFINNGTASFISDEYLKSTYWKSTPDAMADEIVGE